MKNPLLEKEVWDWQDAAVAADWAMERGVFSADLWRCFPPDFVRCLAECPEIFGMLWIPATAGRPGAWDSARSWAGPDSGARARAWVRVGRKAGVWAGPRAWTRARAGMLFGCNTWNGTHIHVANESAGSVVGAGAGVLRALHPNIAQD